MIAGICFCGNNLWFAYTKIYARVIRCIASHAAYFVLFISATTCAVRQKLLWLEQKVGTIKVVPTPPFCQRMRIMFSRIEHQH